MSVVHNPVLRGFNPDPSICRVGNDFYIAVSTFEWFPGVLVYHSRDLVNWQLTARPLDRSSQLNMAGNPASGGVWAPCLSFADDKFWLIYTDVKAWAGSPPEYRDGFKDTHNYLVCAEAVQGPWSDPVYLNSSGFDPSLFHDKDGRKWLVNQIWDYRPGKNSFAGIILQEYSVKEKRLVGPRTNIFRGSRLGRTEAPHLYRRGDWYYLMTAEGGTSYSHAVTIARSRTVEGPYELHPQTPLLSSVEDWNAYQQAETGDGDIQPALCDGLQKAGHGSMVPVTDDEWVLAHLCGRPLPGTLRCPLGRETSLQKIVWKNDEWPWPESRVPLDSVVFDSIAADESVEARTVWREDFDAASWALELQTLRIPAEEKYDLHSRSGWVGLTGGESPESTFAQTILARRVQAFDWQAETRMSFVSTDFQQFAGLIVRYDERTQYILRLHANDDGRPSLGIIVYDKGTLSLPLNENEVPIDAPEVFLGVHVHGILLHFRWSLDGKVWHKIGPDLDASKLSDEYAMPMGFTGTFVGLCCYDVSGRKAKAYFDYLEYRELA